MKILINFKKYYNKYKSEKNVTFVIVILLNYLI